MILLSVEEVQLIHQKLVAATGGSDGLRDAGLLESAVYSVAGGFGEEEAYPTVEEKAARYAYALVKNHAFVDGNKRVGVVAMLTMLRLNDVPVRYTQRELICLGLDLAAGLLEYQDVLEWIRKHRV